MACPDETPLLSVLLFTLIIAIPTFGLPMLARRTKPRPTSEFPMLGQRIRRRPSARGCLIVVPLLVGLPWLIGAVGLVGACLFGWQL